MENETKNIQEKEEKEFYGDIHSLDDTVSLMLSEDYKDRFIAEYAQLKIRYAKLHEMLVKFDAGTLDFKPTCPVNQLRIQKSHMGNLLNQLEIRAELENIQLPKIFTE